MVKNFKGGKGAKSKSNKKEKAKEEERNSFEQNLILPKLEGEEKGTILCQIKKVFGHGRYNLETLNGAISYVGVSRQVRMASKLKIDTIVLAGYRECNTIQRELDIITIYSDNQVKRLAEQGYIHASVINEEPDANLEDMDDDDDDINVDDI